MSSWTRVVGSVAAALAVAALTAVVPIWDLAVPVWDAVTTIGA